jgi:ATP-dependent exoDNAse (exonuclease V) beta subunit
MTDKNFHVYRSSAGSGKTYTLVREYLSIALESNNTSRYRNILAITFTNKAASEMKERVTKYLKLFADPEQVKGGEKEMFLFLCDTLKITEKELSSRAFNTLQSILHNYSDFNITTIDKFILRIIRSFSFDLQLPYNFEVELDGDGLLTMAINNLIAETGKDKKLTAFLVNYIKQLADNDESWDIQTSLLNIAKLTLNENSENNIKRLKELNLEHFVKVKSETSKEVKTYEDYIWGRIVQGKVLIEEAHLTANDFKGKSRGSVWSYFNQKNVAVTYTDAPKPATIKYFEEAEWDHKDSSANIENIQPKLLEFYNQIESYREKESPKYIVLKNIHKQLFQLGLLNEIEKQVLIIKEEKNFIHISEFNKKVAEIVIEQPIPFVYERIGEKFNNYLIDEFQDTSILQWQNLLPLVENSLAYNNKNLIVGDTKQAIYRWRGGDVDQFAYLPHTPHFADNPIIQERTETLKRQFEAHNLNKNFRSLPNVIGFNNLFFQELLPQLPFDFNDYYDDYIQIPGGSKVGGYAEISLVDKEDYQESTFKEIYSTIKDCLSRGFQLKDIAILSRNNKMLTVIAKYLTNNGVPVISSESLNLEQSAEVNFIIYIFRIITVPNDIEAYLKACNYLKEKSPINYFEMFADKGKIETKFQQYLKTNFDVDLPKISGLSLYESFEEVIYTFAIDKNSPFIQTFLDVANKHSKDSNSSEFITFWNEKKSKLFIASPDNINAVSLLTIHKSKGLEFPVVLMPFANNKGKKDSFFWIDTNPLEMNLPTSLATRNKALENTQYAENLNEEDKKSLLDDINVVYVAVTRAVEELYIFIKELSKPDEVNSVEKLFFPVLDKLTEKEKAYTYGEKVVKPQRELEEIVSNSNIPRTTSPWRDKIKISFSAPAIWNVPEHSEESFDLRDPRKFGNLVHNIFAKLDNKIDLDMTLTKMESDGLVEGTDLPVLKELIKNALKLAPLSEVWLDGKHIIEKEIIIPDGTSYRPDRVIKKDNCTYLIDFKTGSPKKSDEKQIKYYEKLLNTLNFSNIKSYLIYTEEGKSVLA